MGRRDNLKIFTTAILVVLLLSSFIFAFIYRNEIYQKLQTIGKSKPGESEDREIATKIPPPILDSPSVEDPSKEEVVTKLPDLPNLEDMEPETGKPRQVSVTSGAETKDRTTTDRNSLKEKMEKIDNSLDGTIDSKTKKEEGVQNSKENPVPEKTKKTTVENWDADTKKRETTKSKPTSSTKVVKAKKSKWPSTYSKKEKRTSSQISKNIPSPSSSNSKLEVRIRNVEETQRSQSLMYEKRFLEIEKRIQSLEKELAK